MSRRSALWAAAAGFIFGAASCTYAPHPADGQLLCSANLECPDGYECQQPADTCWSKTSGPAAYLGTWTFAPSTKIQTACDNGTSSNAALDVTSVVIESGTSAGSDLDAHYPCTACDLLLDVDKTGAHLADSDPNFQNTTGDPQEFLTVTTFDLVTTDGKAARHSATYDLEEDYADGTVVQCTESVTTTLTKT